MVVEYDSTPLTLADLEVASACLTQEIVAALAPYTDAERALHQIAGALLGPNGVDLDRRTRMLRLAMAKGLFRAENG
jgi:hypothetical protein